MGKYLILDADRSLATIGGNPGAEQLLGIPPVQVSDIDSILKLLRTLFVKEVVTDEHPLFPGMKNERERIVLNKQGRQVGLDGIVIDTVSMVGVNTAETVKNTRGKTTKDGTLILDQRGYGILKDKFTRLISVLSELELTIIVNSHVRQEKDEIGAITEMPDIPGSSRQMLKRWFDVVVYNRVRGRKDGDPEYLWQIEPDERRLAKDRLDRLDSDAEGMIPQDFAGIIETYQKNGIENPKILVVGDSGTGKTRALATLADEVDAQEVAEEEIVHETENEEPAAVPA
jgi:hypothetical protein